MKRFFLISVVVVIALALSHDVFAQRGGGRGMMGGGGYGMGAGQQWYCGTAALSQSASPVRGYGMGYGAQNRQVGNGTQNMRSGYGMGFRMYGLNPNCPYLIQPESSEVR
jgi:hypothetical protein